MHEQPRRSAAATLSLASPPGATDASAPAIAATSDVDPALVQIERHKALRTLLKAAIGPDNLKVYEVAVDEEEEVIQALGDVVPTSVRGAAAQLQYMAEIEGGFAYEQSPLVRCMLSVAKALVGGMQG